VPTPKIVVVVPTYNERDSLPILARSLADLRMPSLQLLVVDDSSPDGTGEIADKLAAETPGAFAVLHRPSKDGLGRAYVAGMTRALESADVVIQMDADLSHPVSAIPLMVATLLAGDAAVVLGSRYVEGGSTAANWPWHRRALSVAANLYVNAVLRLHVHDATAGFKAWRAAALQTIDLESIRSDGYSFQVELNYRAIAAGMKIVEVPIRFEERVSGSSKMTLRVQAEAALMPWRLLLGRRR
jgi:dolichol-phosphate mannosyltransferase